MMKPALYSDPWALSDLDKRRLGSRAAVPSAGNDYGAIEAPTLDPMRRPDVLRVADPNDPYDQHSSLWSSSEGTSRGERLVPQITADGRVIYDPGKAQDEADRTGGHLGVYSSPDMADQAAIAMHNYGAEQMQSPSYRPTMWTREDMPGARFRDREAQLKGKPMFDDNQDQEDKPFATSNQNQLAGATGSSQQRGGLAGVGLTGDTRGQAQLNDGDGDEVPAPPKIPSGAFASTGGVPPAPGAGPSPRVAGAAAALTKPTAATVATGAPAVPAAAPAAGLAGKAAAGPMAWLGPIANALAAHQQERQMRRDAAANIGMQYGQSQGEFPRYGVEAARQNRNINNRMGGPGLSGLVGRWMK